ncbi:hypothetical protein CLV56_0224 [Mumia flava]|uniref:Purine nucleoside phosphorylase n=1 Tax=Mumia flava TaxID=1348852 RepID=A0A0B2BUC7_9ACTN|nr:polyphenol oxidase family protein [Mumia flava]PJJ56020.1 hypothetical protein CLV56_0224 [Mumia flava]
MLAFHHRTQRADLAFTDRHGGASSGPWASLNLGSSNGDDGEVVERNLAVLAAALDTDRPRLVLMRQHHSAHVAVVGAEDVDAPPDADALVTDRPDVALLVRVADCVPVLIADDEAGVVAAVHAGRRGVELDVCGAAVAAMRELGARAPEAWIGPRACGRCYEVPEGMRDEVADLEPATWSETSWGTPALDLAAGVGAQLRRDGVLVHDLADHHPACTIEHEDYFSYRRQGVRSGRLGGIVRLRP